jgi:hypothetical protein
LNIPAFIGCIGVTTGISNSTSAVGIFYGITGVAEGGYSGAVPLSLD